MCRFPFFDAALPLGILLLGGCLGSEEERPPGIELGSGNNGAGTVGGDGGGEGGELGSGGSPSSGGAGGATIGTGGLEADTVLEAELHTTNGFSYRGDGLIFNAATVDVSLVVVADAPRGESISESIEVGDSVSLNGVLESEATWVLVESAAASWYSTWQQVDTGDEPPEILFTVTSSDIDALATAAGVVLLAGMAQVVVRVEDALGDGIEAEAQIEGALGAAYSLYPGFDVTGPSDRYGYVALLNVPASEEAGEIDLTVTAAGDSRVVPIRVQGGAVTVVVVTME